MNIAGVEIGGSHPCRFVAEISNNHNGDLSRALRLIDAAKDAGADFVKFQCYLPSELIALRGDGPALEPWGSQGFTMGGLYAKAATPFVWFPDLVAHCKTIGMPWFSSVFGEQSLALVESLDCPALKVARLDNRTPFVEALQRGRRPIVVSEAEWGESYVLNPGLRLYCPEGYPQSRFDFVPSSSGGDGDYDGTFDDFHGFSFHGTSITPCVVAATLGAKIIEAHLMLSKEPSALESSVSLTERQFDYMVRRVREIEGMLA